MSAAAQEARALVAAARAGSLATVGDGGEPWASLVAVAALPDGTPVLLVSTLAEHGRNLQRDPRAGLLVVEPGEAEDPLARGRVTLSGRAEPPRGDEAEAARAAFVEQVRPASEYAGFGDFALYVLRVERVRWVGGYGRMGSADGAGYRAAAPPA